VSPRYVEIYGLPRGTTEILLDEVAALCPPDDVAWMEKDIQAIRSGNVDRFDWEHRIRLPDGGMRWVHARGKVVERGPDGRATRISGATTDIQARKVADEALRASEARFRSLAEGAPVGIFETDVDGRCTYANDPGARMMFLPGGGAIGSAWQDNLHPEDRPWVTREWREATRAGKPARVECRFQGPDGAMRRVQAHASPVHDAAGRHTGHVGFLLDVTDERTLEASLAVSGRLAALGTLVAGVAHEINNPLAGALASQGVAMEEVREIQEALGGSRPPGPEELGPRLAAIAEALGDAQASSQRIARIVRDLNLLGRPDPRRAPVRIGDVVEEALRWLSSSVGSNVSIRVDLKEVPAVMASPGQLQQVIVNLVANAAKSIPEGRRGKVTVRVGPGEPGMARVEVQDDGAGMSPEVLQRMFDPFYTTRVVGQGTGLGLPICHAIVTSHGGTITATSEPGTGSTFRFELPVVAEG
jgi:PAS domain S-box-containing protein